MHATTHRTHTHEGCANWNEDVTIISTLYRSEDAGFREKVTSFSKLEAVILLVMKALHSPLSLLSLLSHAP